MKMLYAHSKYVILGVLLIITHTIYARPVFAQGAVSWGEVSDECADPTRPAGIKCFEAVFANLIVFFVSAAGVALFVMLLIGGYKYLLSGGDSEKTAQARSTMFYAILGIVIMISAYIVLNAIKWFTGVDVLRFEIPQFEP